MKIKIMHSKSGNTACMIFYDEKALVSFWRLHSGEWYCIGTSEYEYSKRYILNEFMGKQMKRIELKKYDLSQCEIKLKEEDLGIEGLIDLYVVGKI